MHFEKGQVVLRAVEAAWYSDGETYPEPVKIERSKGGHPEFYVYDVNDLELLVAAADSIIQKFKQQNLPEDTQNVARRMKDALAPIQAEAEEYEQRQHQ